MEDLNLSNLQPADPKRPRKRVGRGLGSGKGRYSGRGIKGQKSRSGSHKMRPGFEGGQNPIYMRLGKQRGPHSKDAMPMGPHRTSTAPVNVSTLEARFDAGAEVTPEALVEEGVLKNTKTDVKILGKGELTKKLSITAHAVSAERAREDRGRGRHDHAAPRAEGAPPEAQARSGEARRARARGRRRGRGARARGARRAGRGRGGTRGGRGLDVLVARQRLAGTGAP